MYNGFILGCQLKEGAICGSSILHRYIAVHVPGDAWVLYLCSKSFENT